MAGPSRSRASSSAAAGSVAGGVGAEADQHLVRIGADPGGLDPDGFLSGPGPGYILLRQLGGLFCFGGRVAGLVPAGPAALTRWPASARAWAIATSRSV